jgi:hypothetical protein
VTEDIEIKINVSPSNPIVVEIDALEIMRIIMRKAHAREKPAMNAANAIIDYLAAQHGAHAFANN